MNLLKLETPARLLATVLRPLAYVGLLERRRRIEITDLRLERRIADDDRVSGWFLRHHQLLQRLTGPAARGDDAGALREIRARAKRYVRGSPGYQALTSANLR